MSREVLSAEVVFLSPDDGGRQQPPVLGTAASYHPHVVVQDRSVRQARVRNGKVIDEAYLGITFIEGPPTIHFGEPARFTLGLHYHPRVDYSELRTGATFTVREGAKVVAHGVVLEGVDAG